MLKKIIEKTILSLALSIPFSAIAQSNTDNSEAAAICMKHHYTSDQENCMARIKGRYFDSEGVRICAQHHYVSDQENCLVDISNLKFSAETVTVCDRHHYVTDKQSCLKKLGEPYTPPPAGGGRDNIIWNLDRALTELQNNNLGLTRQYIEESKRLVREQLNSK